jgi:hypothetical protein
MQLSEKESYLLLLAIVGLYRILSVVGLRNIRIFAIVWQEPNKPLG